MDELARDRNTPGTDAAFDALARLSVDPELADRYPNGTVLIPADSSDASGLISAAIAESKPITLVFPDGSDVVARPPDAKGVLLLLMLAAVFILDLTSRKRDRPSFVPREWVTEFHAAPAPRAPEPVA